MLTHTWDLAKAIEVEPKLDQRLCENSLAFMKSNEDQIRNSGFFGPEVKVSGSADAAEQLLGFLGRDPEWHSAAR